MVRIERERMSCGRQPRIRQRISVTALAAAGMFGLACWGGSVRAESAPNSSIPGTSTAGTSSAGPSIGDEQVNELIASLEDTRSVIRREAVVRIAQLGPSANAAIPAVTSRLHDEDPYVRAHAARAAYRIGASPFLAAPVLCDLLKPEEPQLCCLASLVLGEIGKGARQALPTLNTCMKASDASVRLHAAEAILKIDPTDWSALRELLTGMEASSADLRYFSANALGVAALDNEQALFALQRALTDEDTNVAITAALNLSKRYHLPRAQSVRAPEIEELNQLIDKLKDQSAVVRQSAAIRLGMSGPAARRAISTLCDRLADPDMAVRVHAAHALWQIERPAGVVVPTLVDLLGISKSNIRIAATYVLGEIGPAAGDALPPLYDVFTGSKLRDRMLITMVISRIEPRDREMVGIMILGLTEQAGDVRYLAAMALGSAPVAHQRRVERALTTAIEDRNLRVQAAASEALDRYRLHIDQARHALSAQYSSNFGSAETTTATSKSVIEARPASQKLPARESSEGEGSSPGDREATERNSIPSISEVARTIERNQAPEAFDDPNPDEGLKSIGQVNASIRTKTGDLPPDYAFAKMSSIPEVFHPLGMTRNWSPVGFGWEAPAMYYKPVYFEDVNLERYGIHYGLASPFISFGKFFGCFPFLPYKMLVQPPLECHYTLGFERPNNCVPVHYFGWGCPKLSLVWWFTPHNYCPIRARWPWIRDFRDCDTECLPYCDTYCEPAGEAGYQPDYQAGGE